MDYPGLLVPLLAITNVGALILVIRLILYRRKPDQKIVSEIVACFADVDWSRQSFIFNGSTPFEAKGESQFYKARSIDEAIKKLNAVLKKYS